DPAFNSFIRVMPVKVDSANNTIRAPTPTTRARRRRKRLRREQRGGVKRRNSARSRDVLSAAGVDPAVQPAGAAAPRRDVQVAERFAGVRRVSLKGRATYCPTCSRR